MKTEMIKMNIHRSVGRRVFCPVLFLAFLLVGQTVSVFAQYNPLHIAVQAGRLTVKATDIPVGKVLQEIARKVEINVYSEADLSEDRITIELSDLAIQEGLAKILGDYNVAYLYSPEKVGSNDTSPDKLTDVWVFSQRKERSPAQREPKRDVNPVDLSGNEMEDEDIPSSRQRLIETASETQDPSAIPVLLNFLRDPDQAIGISAADALSNFGPLVPVDQVVETLRSLDDPQIRLAILTSGLELPHEVMADHALHDPSPQVRIGALHALEGSTDIGEVAREALKDPEPSVQAEAKGILQTLEEDLYFQTIRDSEI